MAISLYEHNETAYRAVLSMLEEKGKAAVIHPTGTGKSFLAFKLCEDHPRQRICWLSPSEYIVQTQLENLQSALTDEKAREQHSKQDSAKADTSRQQIPEGSICKQAAPGASDSGAGFPANIQFYTYARLMRMTPEEIQAIRPDYIILDEFHRCGAQMWGEGVKRLLAVYDRTPVLGLSATAIRYLDQQRNMAEELFEGNVASEMTLGEAVVRGILQPPRYVLSVYSYQKDLERYEKKVARMTQSLARDRAQEALESLRRALDQAEGLEEIFHKHMKDPHGKYLVFCTGAGHMEEMAAKAEEWFAGVDSDPHIYKAYSEDPGTEEAFAAFKADESEHLKLLYCINMLNEGVHVEGVNGVILLRPTVSPIVFKQQIGRALTAGSAADPVIFDIVLNIENLWSIAAIQEEMEAAITYYRYQGDYRRIVNERFLIIDETRDCRQLFQELEQSLQGTWEQMLQEAKMYYQEHGDLQVPAKYKTPSGASLGNWLNVQRKIYSGKLPGYLQDYQIRQLNQLGIVWDGYHDLTWEKNYLKAKAYYEVHGDLRVPARYETEDGFPLGVWISRMRAVQSDGRGGALTPERMRKLNEIGMVWDVLSEQWEKNYLEAAAYYRKNGNLLVPGTYITESGLKLGNWIAHLRMARKGTGKSRITPAQIHRLDLIGMAWDAEEERWKKGLEAAVTYHNQYGNLNVPISYQTAEGYALGSWIHLKRRQYRKGNLREDRVRELEKLGMKWKVR